MNTMRRIELRSIAPMLTRCIGVLAVIAVLAGCGQTEQNDDTGDSEASAERAAEGQQPMGHVVEVDGFTLRANVSRADAVPEAMAEQYDIDRDPERALLSVVILETQSDGQPEPVSAEVNAHYESLTGHSETIDMRAVEADGEVSYVGTLDASDQRVFEIDIEAQPADADQAFQMNFEVQLEAFDGGDSE